MYLLSTMYAAELLAAELEAEEGEAPGVKVCTTTFPETVAVVTTVDEAL